MISEGWLGYSSVNVPDVGRVRLMRAVYATKYPPLLRRVLGVIFSP